MAWPIECALAHSAIDKLLLPTAATESLETNGSAYQMILIPQPDSPLPVVGFHGTTRIAADLILADDFILSENPYDWLGDGVYFFQDAPLRALEWAVDHHGPDAAVVGAKIQLIDCIDLLDAAWTKLMTDAYDQFLGLYKRAGLALPVQTPRAHRLDREVINYIAGVLQEEGMTIRCVRASFAEGGPVYPESAFFDRGHVQIAVRDIDACIIDRWLHQ